MQTNSDYELTKNISSKTQTPKKNKQQAMFANTPMKIPKSIHRVHNNINSKFFIQPTINAENTTNNLTSENSSSQSHFFRNHQKMEMGNAKKKIEDTPPQKIDIISSENGVNQTSLAEPFDLAPKTRERKNIQSELGGREVEYENINNVNMKSKIKRKKDWKSWSSQEKELFYEAIASGGNYTSLQKLFKTMNDKIGTKSTEKIRDYYYRMLKNVNKLLKSVGDKGVNRKNRDEVLLALNCYGKMIISSNSKKKSKLDAMKNLNKHPRLFRKAANTLKRLITSKIKLVRNKLINHISSSASNKNNKPRSGKYMNIKRDSRLNNNMNASTCNARIIDINAFRKIPYDSFIVRITPYDQDTYLKMIESNYSARLEISVSYNKPIRHIIEVLTEKWKNVTKKNKTTLYLCPLEELWIPPEISFFSANDSGRAYDIGDIYTAYGSPSTNTLFMHYQWRDKKSDTAIQLSNTNVIIENNIMSGNISNSLIAQPTINLENSLKIPNENYENENEDLVGEFEANNDSDDDLDLERSCIPLEKEFDDFDPLEFLGVYDGEKKMSTDEEELEIDNEEEKKNNNIEKEENKTCNEEALEKKENMKNNNKDKDGESVDEENNCSIDKIYKAPYEEGLEYFYSIRSKEEEGAEKKIEKKEEGNVSGNVNEINNTNNNTVNENKSLTGFGKLLSFGEVTSCLKSSLMSRVNDKKEKETNEKGGMSSSCENSNQIYKTGYTNCFNKDNKSNPTTVPPIQAKSTPVPVPPPTQKKKIPFVNNVKSPSFSDNVVESSSIPPPVDQTTAKEQTNNPGNACEIKEKPVSENIENEVKMVALNNKTNLNPNLNLYPSPLQREKLSSGFCNENRLKASNRDDTCMGPCTATNGISNFNIIDNSNVFSMNNNFQSLFDNESNNYVIRTHYQYNGSNIFQGENLFNSCQMNSLILKNQEDNTMRKGYNCSSNANGNGEKSNNIGDSNGNSDNNYLQPVPLESKKQEEVIQEENQRAKEETGAMIKKKTRRKKNEVIEEDKEKEKEKEKEKSKPKVKQTNPKEKKEKKGKSKTIVPITIEEIEENENKRRLNKEKKETQESISNQNNLASAVNPYIINQNNYFNNFNPMSNLQSMQNPQQRIFFPQQNPSLFPSVQMNLDIPLPSKLMEDKLSFNPYYPYIPNDQIGPCGRIPYYYVGPYNPMIITANPNQNPNPNSGEYRKPKLNNKSS